MRTTIENILGLRSKIRTPLDLVDLGNKGISKKQIKSLAEAMCLSSNAIAPLLAINVRTIQRQPENKHFDRNVSERAIRLAQLTARGVDAFGTKESFCQWLQTPSLALGNRAPISLLASFAGIEMVDDEIGRMEYGVVA
ncbi:MAG: hypothetical protein A4E57_02383 [Syntrophorhabdaceae bacterium PtaU1.Bin034]|nr:MAG: hypothetical protein A4E57_02383 [Syntrophorhabdaceae bacterium PtaU1.Bin034]